MLLPVVTFLSIFLIGPTFGATAEEWRGRSIYQLLTDRYALAAGADPNKCDPAARTWCGGTWNSIRENLDYIQGAGFTAIWISPVSQNYEGPATAYGDPYHGYWISDVSKLNNRFGTAEDLKALSAELHRRNMYLMVDIVVNNVMATSTNPDLSKYFFKDKSQYHPYCPIQWGNTTSEQNCWLGDEKVPLPDVNTENPTVVSAYGDWIQGLVKEYNIDGLRIDAAKHVNINFWPTFCAKAGVFCMGEVFGSDIDAAAQYQGSQSLDSILNYPMYDALTQAFKIPGPQNMSVVVDVLSKERAKFKDLGLLGNFLENHDLPRWRSLSVDPQSLYNAMAFNFMSDGIPIVYAGQEQGFTGPSDPVNREPLWPSGYAKTPTYGLIARLNQFRNFLIANKQDWLKAKSKVVGSTAQGIAIQRGNVVSILTNVGSPPANMSTPVRVPYESGLDTTDIISCRQFVVSSGGWLDVEYTKGGVPVIVIPTDQLAGSKVCEKKGPVPENDGKHALKSQAVSLYSYHLLACLSIVMSLFILIP